MSPKAAQTLPGPEEEAEGFDSMELVCTKMGSVWLRWPEESLVVEESGRMLGPLWEL